MTKLSETKKPDIVKVQIFRLKKVWFEKIKSGEKTHEYRIYKDYWIQREHLFAAGNVICFTCGYGGERLFATVQSVRIKNGLNTDLKINVPVFDISFVLFKNLTVDELAAQLDKDIRKAKNKFLKVMIEEQNAKI